jgi:DNA (cytosine-5)-methyltransferase 1
MKNCQKGIGLLQGDFPASRIQKSAGGGGAKDKRNLWHECEKAISGLRPFIALFENVPGLFSSDKGKFFNKVLSDISKCGYAAEWQIISAKEVGAIHKRERVWIIAYSPSAGIYGSAVQCEEHFKENNEKQKEWEQFYSLSYRNYKITNWEKIEGRFCGNDDGLFGELDRFKCLGNAIVPQCAEKIMMLPTFDRWRVLA